MIDDNRPTGRQPSAPAAADQPPDPQRRRLAKAALASPIIMSLGPRRVWSQEANCAPGVISLINSIDGAGGAIPGGLSLAPGTLDKVDDCSDCLTEYSGRCTDHEDLRATCESAVPSEDVEKYCPTTTANEAAGDSLRESKAPSWVFDNPHGKPADWTGSSWNKD